MRVEAQLPEREAATANVQKLERWKGVLDKASGLQLPVDAANEAIETALETETSVKRVASEAHQKLQELQVLQKELPEHTKALSDAAASLTKLQQEAEMSGRYEASVVKRDQQARKVEELAATHQTMMSHLTDSTEAFTRAEQELTDVQALHVARKLAPGEPCPACGSHDHPDPATGDPERLGRHETFEAAEQALNKAQEDEREAKGQLDSAKTILADRQQELDALIKPERDRETLATLLSTARSTKESLENDRRFNELESRLTAAEQAFSSAETSRGKTSQDLARLKEVGSNAQTALLTNRRSQRGHSVVDHPIGGPRRMAKGVKFRKRTSNCKS